jgi:hypothetical protein
MFMFEGSAHTLLRSTRALALAAAMAMLAAAAQSAPQAVVTPPAVTVNEGDLVSIDGSGSTVSEPGESIVFHQWIFNSTPQGFVGGPPTTFNFTAPQVPNPPNDATHTVVLQVFSDVGPNPSEAQATITVRDVNENPQVNAGADKVVNEGQSIQFLDSSATDNNNDPLTLSWDPTAGLNFPAALHPTFTAPSVTVDTPITFTFTANDGRGGIVSDTMVVTVVNVNQPPTANAGADVSVIEGLPVALDGTGSSDPDGQTLNYSWVRLSGPRPIDVVPANSATPTFQAPGEVTSQEIYVYQLTVSDGNLSDTDTVQVTVTNGAPPVANAGADDFATENTTVTLQGSATDPDSLPNFTWSWTRVAGPNVTILNPNSPNATFIAPAVDQDTFITFSLLVTDPEGNTDTDEVSWVIRDVAQALPQNPLLTNLAIYPSPFNAESGATIRYDLRFPANVEVLVVDVFGRVVRELQTPRSGAGGFSGTNLLRWDGKNGDGDTVGNGAYIVQVTADDGAGQRGKMKERVGVRN